MSAPKRSDARLYRYGGIVVRLVDGRLEPVRRSGQLAHAAKDLAPLPKHLRREIAAAAEQDRAEST